VGVFRQGVLFDERTLGRALPVVGEQKDIRYYGTFARSVLNPPETTQMGFWSVNPYVGCAFGCAYCYARYTHRWVLDRQATAHPELTDVTADRDSLPPWLAFERRIFVKQNAADALRRALRHGSEKHATLLEGDSIVVGTATDPYQPAERRFRVTRSVLEVLAEHPGLSIGIITKSPLITRDVDVLRRIARHSSLSIHISLITVDRELARRLEPRAPTPEARLRALARLREHELEASINVMPVLPGITDAPAQLEELVKAVAAHGATYVASCALRLRSSARQRYLPFIEREFPRLAKRYWATYAYDHRVSSAYSERLSQLMRTLCERHGVPYGYPGADDDSDDAEDTELREMAATEQLELLSTS
jgi:DNA repair photolyase